LLLAACATTAPSPPSPAQKPGEPAAARPPAAPAAPTAEELMLRDLVPLQDRLYRVAAPLLVNNTELCKSTARNLLGFTAKNKYSFSDEYVAAAQKLYGLGDRLQVTGVLENSGAARVGVRNGDVLLAVEERELPQGESAERQAATVLAPLMTGRSSVTMTVLRSGARQSLTVPLTYACAFGVELGNTDNVTAYADGHRVLITRGMMNFARSDDDLAYVMAKEMAHNALAHAARLRMNATIGGIIDNLTRMRPDMSTMAGLAGVKPMPQDLDAMADKLALYMLVRAGYKVDGAPVFWQRLAAQYPPTVLNAYTAMHPSTTYRVTVMQRTLRDIKAKQAAKKPLLP
jgi:hypothetical protein